MKNFEKFLLNVKPGTLAIIIIVIALALYLLFNKKKSDSSQQAVDGIKVNPDNLTIDTTDLDFKTSQIFDAMNQYGTDFDTIYNILKSLQTKDELLYIIKAFGVKPYFLTGLADGLATRFMGTQENLIGWFHEELSKSELQKVTAEFTRLGVNILSV